MRAERPILLRFLNVLTSLNGFIIKRIVFLFLVKYIASGTLRFIFLIDNINLFRNYGLRAPSFKLLDFFFRLFDLEGTSQGYSRNVYCTLN